MHAKQYACAIYELVMVKEEAAYMYCTIIYCNYYNIIITFPYIHNTYNITCLFHWSVLMKIACMVYMIYTQANYVIVKC